MSSKDPLYIARQLLRYKKDQLSFEEKKEIEQLFAQDSLLEQIATDLDDKVKVNQDLAIIESFDTEAALAKQSIPVNKHVLPIVKTVQPFSRFLWVAASLVLVAISIVVFRSYFVQENSSQYTTSKKVDNSIKLLLASGKEISLDTLFTTTNDQLVLNNKDGELSVHGQNLGDKTEAQEMNTLIVPYQNTYRLVLPDGSKVQLNAGSTLQFPSDFAGNERRVILSGEGYFEVTPNEDKKFIVETGSLQVEVLGTIFNLKSYGDDSMIYTTLLQGKVAITGVANKVQILSRGEQAVYNKKTNMLVSGTVDTAPSVLWKDGLFYFKNNTLEDIMKQLARWYDLEIEFDEPGMDTVLFNGKIKMYDSVKDVLRKFEKTGGVSFDVKYNHVLVKKVNTK